MDSETRQLVERRFEQIRRGVEEAIRREVAWLERHNFPVWVWRDGRVVDARKTGGASRTLADGLQASAHLAEVTAEVAASASIEEPARQSSRW